MRVVVMGAGIVGACSALELLRDGHQVTLLEPAEAGAEQAASHGNGAWLSPASVVPMAMPGLWKKVPGYLLDPQSPLTIRWRSLPALLPWLFKFVQAGSTVAKVEATARSLSQLLHDAPQRHQQLASEAGVAHLLQQRGLMYAYPDRAAFQAERLAWRLRRDNGVSWEECDVTRLHEMLPALSARYTFGVWVKAGANLLNPGEYVQALIALAVSRGLQLRKARALGFRLEHDVLRAVRSSDGDIPCDRAVIASGIGSLALAREAGDAVPMQSERGYNVVLREPGIELAMPVMPSDGRMANTLTNVGLRVAGQVELASQHTAPDWRRADILLRHAQNTYPHLPAGGFDALHMTRWLGHRPSVADGLPVIGPASGCAQVLHAFGHGHVGLASGPVTGRLVADLVGGLAPVINPQPYSVQRFTR